jgi:hypothetical protein
MPESLELTEFEKNIYNVHLRITRQQLNQPFKYRKDFSSLDEQKVVQLKKLSLFFSRFKHIKIEDFIVAPYKLYTDEDHFDLNYYITLKATKAYALYQKKLLFADPDSDEQLQNIKTSLQFILTFCRENNLTLDKYITHKEAITPSFILHLQEHNVNVYTLLGFQSFSKEFFQLDSDTMRFILDEELYDQIDNFRVRLFASKKALILVTQGLQKIQTLLQQNTCN